MITQLKNKIIFTFLLANIFICNINAQSRYNPYSSYKKGYGFGSGYDSRYFRHGSPQNERTGGTCTEFLQLNSLSQCCASRDDDCYMIHFDTRCYCDLFCDRSKVPDNSDCCPDAEETCIGKAETLPPPPPPPIVQGFILNNLNELLKDNQSELLNRLLQKRKLLQKWRKIYG